MTMINCLECNKKISNKADSCPNCGCPVTKDNKTKKAKKISFLLKLILWIVGYFFYITMLPPIGGIIATLLLITFIAYAKFNPKGQELFSSFASTKLFITSLILGSLAIILFFARHNVEVERKEQVIAKQEAEQVKKIKLDNLRQELQQSKKHIW